MLEIAANIIAKQCARYADVVETADDIATYIINVNSGCHDGFELAQEMCRDGCQIVPSMVEILDSLSYEVDDLVKAAEVEWVKSENIKPPFPVGTAITEGIIAGIYDHSPARYLVKEAGCKNDHRHLIIKFEDADNGALSC